MSPLVCKYNRDRRTVDNVKGHGTVTGDEYYEGWKPRIHDGDKGNTCLSTLRFTQRGNGFRYTMVHSLDLKWGFRLRSQDSGTVVT